MSCLQLPATSPAPRTHKPYYPDLKNFLPFTAGELKSMDDNRILSVQVNYPGSSVIYHIRGNQVEKEIAFYRGRRELPFYFAWYDYDHDGRLISIRDSTSSEMNTQTIRYSPEGYISGITYINRDRRLRKVLHTTAYSIRLAEVTDDYLCYKRGASSFYYFDRNYEFLSMKSPHRVDSSVIYKDPDNKWRKVFYTKESWCNEAFWKCYEEEYEGRLKIAERLFPERDSLKPHTSTRFFYDQENRLRLSQDGNPPHNIRNYQEYYTSYFNGLGLKEYDARQTFQWQDGKEDISTTINTYQYFTTPRELQMTRKNR
jgi:hypothetical protein